MDDDSQGKYRAIGVKSRSAILSAVFIIGICLGIIVSEKAYIWAQEADTPPEALDAVRSRKLERQQQKGSGLLGGGSTKHTTTDSTKRYTGKPRNDLERLLRQIAPNGEVMIAISNMNLIHETSLTMWLDCVERSHTLNWLVVAIDEGLRDYMLERNLPVYYRPVVIPKHHENTGDNHAISAMKYQIILEFLELGYDVLLSDVDIVTVQSPWDHLHRDSDVEGMTDGFDEPTSKGEIYGVDDETMGWSRYAQGYRHMAMNSGLFYVRSNERTIDLMKRIAASIEKETIWDQTAYNVQMFMLSYKDYKAPQVSVRVMDIHKFMNSKVLFKFVRRMPQKQQPRPVMVHMNYHPDKSSRMAAAIQYYFDGDKAALDSFPGGSEPGS